MKIAYETRRFSEQALKTPSVLDQITESYAKQGLDMTLRQLYYQMVARGLLPNEDREYTRLGTLVRNGRMAGLLSWTAIVDRGRNLRGLSTVSCRGEALKRAASSYRLDLWADQRFRPEVWVEKQALEGVVQGICNQLRVDFFACKGYNSASEQWAAGQRFAGYVHRGQVPVVLHLGDHDPSGLDMTRDNAERLEQFTGVKVAVQRLALNMDQITKLNPPPNPTKLTDSRATDYLERYGQSSWELDALEPTAIRDLISEAVVSMRDDTAWGQSLAAEVDDRRWLGELQ